MFGYCCGHATIVAPRHHYLPQSSSPRHPRGQISFSKWRGGLLPGHSRGHGDDGIASDGSPCQRCRAIIAMADHASRCDLAGPYVQSPRPRAATLRRATSTMCQTDRVIFVQRALFAPVFVTRRRSHDMHADGGFAFHTRAKRHSAWFAADAFDRRLK